MERRLNFQLPSWRESLARLPLTDRITYSRELVSGTLYGAYAGIALPLVPIVARKIGMTTPAITAMVTMQFVGALLGILLGKLAEHRHKMPFVVWPNIVGRGIVFFLAFARDPTSFLVIASIFYFSLNVTGPAYSSIMRTNYSGPNRGRLMGNIRVLVTLMSAGVSTVAAVILVENELLVRWLFAAAGILGVLCTVTFSTIKVRRDPGMLPAAHVPIGTPRGSSLRLLAANGRLLAFLAVFFLCAAPDKLAVPLEPVWMVDDLHIDYAQASFLLGTVTSLASVGGYVFFAWASRRRNSFRLMALVVILFAGRFACLAAARTGIALLPMSVLSGICNAGWDLVPLFCMIDLTDPSSFSFSYGVHTTLFGVRGVVGPAVGAWLYSAGLPLPLIFWLISGLIGAGAVLMFLFSRRDSGRRRTGERD